MKILVIDDEPLLVQTIRLGWPDQEDEITSANSFAEAMPIIYSNQLLEFDCIILDLRLPDGSGSKVLSEIRQLTSTPVIMLSAWGDSQFRAELLSDGADDYVMKPVGMKELYARATKLVEGTRERVRLDRDHRIGNVILLPSSRELLNGETRQALTGAEAALLTALAQANGGVVSRQDLYLKAFGREGRYGEKALETYIGRLRKKLTILGEDGAKRILSVRGQGYRLVLGN
ncbi:MAG: response regulator transcription factor [Henriciella sp.]|uniref:response regulator transcription factor n=1 Tax=Henriciella sp. TaxID=1968823 RepID=UPI0026130A3B|nr:response regulator transcription factor [Henriciella sp.]